MKSNYAQASRIVSLVVPLIRSCLLILAVALPPELVAACPVPGCRRTDLHTCTIDERTKINDGESNNTSGQGNRAAERQQRGQAIADHLMNTFDSMQERNRAWEDMQEARRERERREAAEERAYYARQQEAERAAQAARARQFEAAPAKASTPTITPKPSLPSYVRYDDEGRLVYSGPHTSHQSADCPCLKYPLTLPGYENRKSAAPRVAPVVPVLVSKSEPYRPPSLGGFLSDDAQQFGAGVLAETATILVEQFNDSASDLRDAAMGGIRDLPGRTYDAIADDLLDSGKDAAKDAAMNLLSEDKQIFIRAVDIPLSILTRNWDAVQEAWSGQNSLWERHVRNPLDEFTVETSVERQNERIAYLRKRIQDCDENIQYYARRIARFKESLGTPGLHRLEYEYRENEIRRDAKYLEDARRRKAEYEALLKNISP